MFTALRRFEFGRMLLNTVPVLVGAAIASKLFTELPAPLKMLFGIAIGLLSVSGFFVLPKSMSDAEDTGVKRK